MKNSDTVRIVTWNMNNAGAARRREARAWDNLLDVIRPDVALLQEVRLPGSTKSSLDPLTTGSLQYREFSAHHGWGTAIFSSHIFQLRELRARGLPTSTGAAYSPMRQEKMVAPCALRASTRRPRRQCFHA